MTSSPHTVSVIAEVGVNHNGKIDTALRLVEAAKEAGADIVKFQIFSADGIVLKNVRQADYQVQNIGQKSDQYSMLKSLELSKDDYFKIIDYCQQLEINFLFTPFDEESLDTVLNDFNQRIIKIGSGDLTNAPMLLKIAQHARKVILSSGMASMAEIKMALSILGFGYLQNSISPGTAAFETAFTQKETQKLLQENVTLLHCTTQYPSPLDSINLRAMKTLKNQFNLKIGFSDHSEGILAAIAAVSLGATVVEKHLTLDRTMEGPDHIASTEPHQFKDMIRSIRDVETALGSDVKAPTQEELKNAQIARKNLVAKKTIKKGDLFTRDNLCVKRSGTGINALTFFDQIGKTADQDYAIDDVIQP
ncbi:N-acetylneuraminate synthase [Terasakiella sp. A23]|uniref:N-acetylneuraminate synthase n=1 Tax=Terasakiella sp. FCG-A23 TaxID=3080561 RepID=UPI0029541C46|nr:N-acetylneuraminate synthase [Terasakiella sp. A23]MDV7339790.1 N-acetylneuraminate synthase [Terasakiella sp. A23]